MPRAPRSGGAALLSTHCWLHVGELWPLCGHGSRPPLKARTSAERVVLFAGGPCFSFVRNVVSGRCSKRGAPVLSRAHTHMHAHAIINKEPPSHSPENPKATYEPRTGVSQRAPSHGPTHTADVWP